MENLTFNFDCGCKVKLLDSTPKELDGLPSMEIDYDNLNLECNDTWNLFGTGNTKGVFQLESYLGQEWSNKIRPRNIEELSAVISVIRPGIKNIFINDKSLPELYVARKFGQEPINYSHPSLEPILKDNYGIMLYQEDSLLIAKDIAGFTLSEADTLRKATSKKLPELMAKIEHQFIEGCKNVKIVDEYMAQQLFDWIRESQKYSFNRCLLPTSIVITQSGYKKIEELYIGELIYSFSGWTKVINIYNNGTKSVFRTEFETEDGHYGYICSTLNHKLMTADGRMLPIHKIIEEQQIVKCGFDTKCGPLQSKNCKFYQLTYLGEIETVDIEVDNSSHTFYSNADGGNVFFNVSNSHGVGYAMTAYQTCWVKQHFPLHFYASWLRFAKERLKPNIEIRDLVSDAKLFNIDIVGPNILDLDSEYKSDVFLDPAKVHFGIRNIKGVGDNHIKELLLKISVVSANLNKNIKDWSWFEFLLFLSTETNKTVFNGIIAAGALDHLKISRQRMLFEYDKFCSLTKSEIKSLKENYEPLKNHNLKEVVEILLKRCNNKRRRVTLESVYQSLIECPYNTSDEINWIVDKERSLLGTPINYSKTLMNNFEANCTAIDFIMEQEEKPIIAGEIVNLKVIVCKKGQSKGKEMAFFNLEDETGVVNCVVFSQNYYKYIKELYESNTILVYGKKGDKQSLIVNKIVQI